MDCSSGAHRSITAKCEKLWVAFHQVRFSTVTCIWEKFLLAYHVPIDHFSILSVNQKVFKEILLREISQGVMPAAASVSPNLDSLSKDELNVLQYACGYVPQHLLKKFQKRSCSKYD